MPKSSIRRRILSALVAFAISSSAAFAWCFNLPRRIDAEYSQSGFVVVAKVSYKNHLHAGDRDTDYSIYTLETIRTIRGNTVPSFRIYEENDSGRASFNWNVGESYLLFLNSARDGMWTLDGCGNSARLDHAKSTLLAIAAARHRKGGLIQGLVFDPGGSPVMGIAIEIRSPSLSYRVITDRKGEFNAHVNAGRFSVVPVREGWSFEKDDASYEDPNDINIEDGGAAQVQFSSRINKKSSR